jgi:hypothetical protein
MERQTTPEPTGWDRSSSTHDQITRYLIVGRALLAQFVRATVAYRARGYVDSGHEALDGVPVRYGSGARHGPVTIIVDVDVHFEQRKTTR